MPLCLLKAGEGLSLEADQLFSASLFPETLRRKQAMENTCLYSELYTYSFCRAHSFLMLSKKNAGLGSEVPSNTGSRCRQAVVWQGWAWRTQMAVEWWEPVYSCYSSLRLLLMLRLKGSRLRCCNGGCCSISLSRGIHSCSYSAQQDFHGYWKRKNKRFCKS